MFLLVIFLLSCIFFSVNGEEEETKPTYYELTSVKGSWVIIDAGFCHLNGVEKSETGEWVARSYVWIDEAFCVVFEYEPDNHPIQLDEDNNEVTRYTNGRLDDEYEIPISDKNSQDMEREEEEEDEEDEDEDVKTNPECVNSVDPIEFAIHGGYAMPPYKILEEDRIDNSPLVSEFGKFPYPQCREKDRYTMQGRNVCYMGFNGRDNFIHVLYNQMQIHSENPEMVFDWAMKCIFFKYDNIDLFYTPEIEARSHLTSLFKYFAFERSIMTRTIMEQALASILRYGEVQMFMDMDCVNG